MDCSPRDSFGRYTIPAWLRGGAHDCPDCLSETVLEQSAPGVYIAKVMHDDGCPWLAQREARIRHAKDVVKRLGADG